MDATLELIRKRVRVPNFTAEEKALLVQLIKRRPIIEAKQTDGKSVLKKKAAWDLIEKEFNCHAHVHQRDVITLKRAWDNMKAVSRKARAAKRGNVKRTPIPSTTSPVISMVEEAAPNIITNPYDSDGIFFNSIVNARLERMAEIKEDTEKRLSPPHSSDSRKSFSSDEDVLHIDMNHNSDNEDQEKQCFTASATTHIESPNDKEHVQKPFDYVRREAVLRMKHLNEVHEMKMKILNEKLEVQETKKRAIQHDEEISKILLEKAKLELEELQNKLSQ